MVRKKESVNQSVIIYHALCQRIIATVFGVYKNGWSKDLQNNSSDTYFFAYKIKTNYFMTKQVVWTFRLFLFLQFDTKFPSKQQRLAKIYTILWLLLSTQISQVWLATGKIRGRKGQYYQAHIPRSWPLSTTARFATKGGLIQIQTGMHWWRAWMESHC